MALIRISVLKAAPWESPKGVLLHPCTPTSAECHIILCPNFPINHRPADSGTAHHCLAVSTVLGWGGCPGLGDLILIVSRCCRKRQPSAKPGCWQSSRGVDAHISCFIALFSLQLSEDALSKQCTCCLHSTSFHPAASGGF